MAALGCAGCPSNGVRSGQPAHIVDASAASRGELERAVSQALNVENVLLADDALTHSSWLIIEQASPRSIDNVPLSGRELGTSERFRLLRHDGRCVLEHESSGRHFELAETDCVPE